MAVSLPERTFRYRVLIVDDEVDLRLLGKSILESQGYEVHCAEDGFEGLAALKRALPDMIISDLQMPNMNGFEFLSVVRQRFPAVPVIVISGELLGDLPNRPRSSSPKRAAVWAKNDRDLLAVTCSVCLRTFPVGQAAIGLNEADCDFCASRVEFEILCEQAVA